MLKPRCNSRSEESGPALHWVNFRNDSPFLRQVEYFLEIGTNIIYSYSSGKKYINVSLTMWRASAIADHGLKLLEMEIAKVA